jgi:hypothetical protein
MRCFLSSISHLPSAYNSLRSDGSVLTLRPQGFSENPWGLKGSWLLLPGPEMLRCYINPRRAATSRNFSQFGSSARALFQADIIAPFSPNRARQIASAT